LEVENRQSASITFETPGTYPVTLVVKSADGLERSHTEQIVVHPQPDASFEIEDGQILNYSTGTVAYEWELITAGRKRDISDQFQVEYDPSWKGGESLILIATNIFGCTDTMFRTIPHPAGPELRFPNVFRPNPGGATGGWYNPAEPDNNVFHPQYDEVPNTYNMKLFNKNGELIFESDDIRKGWDGYYQNAPAARGVYIYHCTGTWKGGEIFSYKGDVTLLQHYP
jgi:PKD repeat protein